jgi:radical SAM/Cys-rich protein
MSIGLPILDGTRFRARFEADLRAAPVITTLQVNIGYVCNLACRHCHVESSPARSGPADNMDEATARRVVEWALAQPGIETIDLTGGSPEMNPSFRWIVETVTAHGRRTIDRCNPTIVEYVDPQTGADYAWVPEFLARHAVQVVASLPCYLEENVERQRGRGSYDASIEGLRRLVEAGYGTDPDLVINLVYNPVGPHLPPPQPSLEEDYKRELRERFGLRFNELWTITNMPIKRWRHELERDGQLEPYMSLLMGAFNASTIDGLMCRHQISIDPHGRLYDCDFNQAIGLATPASDGRFIWEYDADELAERVIATDDHCYGCTAGSGSSCGGALA